MATAVALNVGVYVPVARSQTLTWGATGGGGTGTWNTTTSNWFDGSTAVPWTQGDSAIFGGTAGTVTLGTTITAQDLTFQKDGYTITSNTLTLGVSGTPTVTLGVGISATISSIVAGSNGLTVTGGGTLTLTGANTYSGATTINAGTLTYSGAASSSGGGNLNVATVAGNTAVVNFNSSGTLTFNGAINVGASGGAGAVNQTAGTVKALNGPFIYIEIGNGAAGTYGSYVLSGGSLNTTGGSGIRVGDGTGGIGIFTQTGGTLSLSRFFAVAANAAGEAPVGVATFTGGTATVASGFQFLVGDSNGTGVLNLGTQAGGMAVLTNQNSSGFLVTNGNVTTGSGTLNLNSGVLNQTAGSINKAGPAGATAVVNFNGGTLQAGANNLTLIDNTLNSVNVYNGGAVFDTNGFTATVSANLRGTAGNGVYPAGGTLTLASGGGVGYIGAPYVQVTGGSGSSAMAIANVSGGVVTGVTLTNPGQNYQAGDTLTFSFTGGGTSTAAGPFQYTLTSSDVASNTSGGVTKVGAGTLVLTGTNTYTGGTTISAGTLQLGNGGTSGSITGNVADNGTLAFDRSDTATFAGVISGTGSLVQAGTGTTILTGTNTYSGGTTISAGTLQIGNGGTTGSIVSDVTDNATLAFNHSDTVTFGGVISGAGALVQAGSGTLILTGNNTYTGGTTISTGTLQIGNGGTTGSIVGDVLDNGTLVFDHGGSAKNIFAGVISGSGSLVKLGSDTLELTADNTYSGGTTIEDGILVAGVPTAGQATSFALGTGDVFLQAGTLRAPSLDPLVINVGRNYTQASGGTLELGVAGVNGVEYDRVQVGGNASLNGTLAVSSLAGFHPVAGNAFGVLTSGGARTGQFATVNDFLNNNPLLQRVDVYSPNGATLVYLAAVTPAPTSIPVPTPTPAPSPTPNPRSAVIVVTPVRVPPLAPGEPIPPSFIFEALDPTAEQLTSMFEIGFSGANTQRLKLDERFDEIYRGVTGFSSNLPPAPVPVTTGKEVAPKEPVAPLLPAETRWGVWANGWGDWVSVGNDGVFAPGYRFTTGGFMIGVDYRITDHFAVGLLGGYAHTATNLQPSGDIDVNTGRGGLYATYFDKGFYVNAAAYGGYNGYSTSRAALLGNANGNTSGGEFSTWAEAGYDFRVGDFTVGPLGALQYTLVHLAGFGEEGSLLPLQIRSDTQTSLRTDLGARVTYTWHLGKMVVIPTVTVAWEHEYLYTTLPITVGSTQFPGSATFSGPSEGHDSAIVNAGAAFQLTSRLSTYLGYQGQLGRDRYNANGVSGGFSFSF